MSSSSDAEERIDVRSLAQIYKSGDLLLENPAETCIIFVSVIIVSAALEYLLQVVNKFDNRYVRLMVTTMTKEMTIIGVLALGLMLASSLMPAGEQQERYSILFTWANMNLFFMALFFVLIVLAQFLWSAFEQPKWRAFEEGRMDSEEVDNLWYRERVYKKVYERYADELLMAFTLTPADCAMYEMIQVFNRRLLVNMSDLSWPVWLFLIPIIALNGARAYLNPLDEGQNYTFYNGLLYIAATGFVTMIVFFIAFALLQSRLTDMLEKRVRRSTVGAHHVPLGSPKRFISLLQAVIMSLNWYISLFATGMGRDILTQAAGWQVAVMMILFFVPIIAVHACIPWCVSVLAFMSVMGSVPVHQGLIERVIRRHRGDDDADDDDDDIDSEEEQSIRAELEKRAAVNQQAAAHRAAKGKHFPKGPPGKGKAPAPKKAPPKKAPPPRQLEAQPVHEAIQVEARHRPGWMDEDDVWEGDEGEGTAGAADAVASSRRMDPLFFEHVDETDLRDAMFRSNPGLRASASTAGQNASSANRGQHVTGMSPARAQRWEQMETDYTADDDPFDNHERPAWLDSDEDWM